MNANATTEHDGPVAAYKEKNNYPEGRSGGGTMKKRGPAARGGVLSGNPTSSGGVNRATRGKGQR